MTDLIARITVTFEIDNERTAHRAFAAGAAIAGGVWPTALGEALDQGATITTAWEAADEAANLRDEEEGNVWGVARPRRPDNNTAIYGMGESEIALSAPCGAGKPHVITITGPSTPGAIVPPSGERLPSALFRAANVAAVIEAAREAVRWPSDVAHVTDRRLVYGGEIVTWSDGREEFVARPLDDEAGAEA